MRILVTGANGFVGKNLLPYLQNRGHEIFVFEHSSSKGSYNKGDISVYEDVKECISTVRPDAVIHLAAISRIQVTWENPLLAVDVNIRGTLNILQAIKEFSPKTIYLNIGSGEEYGLTALLGEPLSEEMMCQPQNPYALCKFCAGQMTLQIGRRFGIKVIHVRPFNHYGMYQNKNFVISDFASKIVSIERGEREPVLYVGNLEACRDFTFVTDVIDAYCSLIENADRLTSGVYNVCSGKSMSIKSILDVLLSFCEKEISVRQDKIELRPSDIPCFIGSNKRIRNEIGWQPKYDVEYGLKRTLDYWRNIEIDDE